MLLFVVLVMMIDILRNIFIDYDGKSDERVDMEEGI